MPFPPDRRHPEVLHFEPLFAYQHLPEGPLRDTSEQCHDLAVQMVVALPDGIELVAGLRKLLEAKDCFVRQALVLKAEQDRARLPCGAPRPGWVQDDCSMPFRHTGPHSWES